MSSKRKAPDDNSDDELFAPKPKKNQKITSNKRKTPDSNSDDELLAPKPNKLRKLKSKALPEPELDLVTTSTAARSKKVQKKMITQTKTTPLYTKPSANASYNIRPFDVSKIRPNSTILFVGNRRTGKSTAMRSIMNEMKDLFYDAYIYSATNEQDKNWLEVVPEKYFRYCPEKFNAEKLQEDLRNQLIRRKKVGNQTPPTLFVFEDVEALVKPSLWHTAGVRTLAFNGRHFSTYAFFAIQYLMSIPKEFRGAFDYCFIMMEKMASIRQAIYDQFAGVFPTYQEFEKVFTALTENLGCMVLDMRALSSKIEDNVFIYHANPNAFPFQIGCKDIRDQRIDDINKRMKEEKSVQEPESEEPPTKKRKTKKTDTGVKPTRGRGKKKGLEVEDEGAIDVKEGVGEDHDESLTPLSPPPTKKRGKAGKPETQIEAQEDGSFRVSII